MGFVSSNRKIKGNMLETALKGIAQWRTIKYDFR